MGNIGTGELLLIFLVTLLVFGAKRIPEIARGLGQGIREFKNATRELSREMNVIENPVPRVRATPDAPVLQEVEHSETPAPASTIPASTIPASTMPASTVPTSAMPPSMEPPTVPDVDQVR
jgi:sec-independent protein translocase protein TatA